MSQAPPLASAADSVVPGFQLLEKREIPEISATGYVYEHLGTKAKVVNYHVPSDSNKVFTLAFPTPVENSKGIPHILEHSVLCGSKNYPVQEPFLILLKSSLKTFLNAMTYPDRTVYPVASTNAQDFENLTKVYMDACLHPRCVREEHILDQEGWSIQMDSAEDTPKFKGVVYSEMKGVYSDPDSRVGIYGMQSVFPDVGTYANYSGGYPPDIPTLKFPEFKEFHEKYYHPTQGYFCFYGDLSPERPLEMVSEALKEFVPSTRPKAVLPTQPLWTAPRERIDKYPLDSKEPLSKKSFYSANWVLTEDRPSLDLMFKFSLIDYLLLGLPSCPLRQALSSSGLGSNVSGGFDDTLRQPTFTVSVSQTDLADWEALRDLTLKSLAEIVDQGFEENLLLAALNTFEFKLKEQNSGRYPKGLNVIFESIPQLLYTEQSPFEPWSFQPVWDAVKAEIVADPTCLTNLIRDTLLKNPHRMDLVLTPEHANPEATLEAQTLEDLKNSWNPAECQAMAAASAKLKELQEVKDTPEALATLPTLNLEDLDRKVPEVPQEISNVGPLTFVKHALDTQDILHVNLSFSLPALSDDQLVALPLLARLLKESGTSSLTPAQVQQRIGIHTGGLKMSHFVSASFEGSLVAALQVTSKFFLHSQDKATSLLKDILVDSQLPDQARVLEVLREMSDDLDSRIKTSGHSIASTRASAGFLPSSYTNECLGGMIQQKALKELLALAQSDFPGLLARLNALKDEILCKSADRPLFVGVTGSAAGMDSFSQEFASQVYAHLKEGPAFSRFQPQNRLEAYRQEGIPITSEVNYCASVGQFEDVLDRFPGAAHVAVNVLSKDYLWNAVRVLGGAYGAFCSINDVTKLVSFASYRDPKSRETLEAFLNAPDFLINLDLSEAELAKLKIGTIGDIHPYMLADARGRQAFNQYLIASKYEDRQRVLDQVFATRLEDIHEFGRSLKQALNKTNNAVVGSHEVVQQLNYQEVPLAD
jgi:hypothetical protein